MNRILMKCILLTVIGINWHLNLILADSATRPNIVFILADDLGWNDVGFHGSSQIPTPNIDSLAYSGLILNNYYVTPLCTPSRSALMTGKYPIHLGMQHGVLYGAEPRGLPLTEKLLPQYLKELGYATHLVGKWHLGSYKAEYTPTYRGFDSHLGIWTGHHDYFDHTAVENPGWGLDIRRNMDIAYDLHGQYSTDIFTDEALRIIHNHNTSEPLFLYIAHVATHSGNPYEPLRAPDDVMKNFRFIEDYNRQRFAAILSKVDDSVGKVVSALEAARLLENSVIIFSSDNGGPAAGFNLNAASNFPLRGVKNTLWEGGVKAAGFLWSPLIQKPKRIANQMLHISDWLPTLLYIAESNYTKFSGNIDGINVWEELSHDLPSPRLEVLHNIDDIYGNAALTKDKWKLLQGTTYKGHWDNWYGPSGRNYSYDTKLIQECSAGKALKYLDKLATPEEMLKLRGLVSLDCNKNEERTTPCDPLIETCLFNIEEDPCELNNVAEKYPNILANLKTRLAELNSTVLPPSNLPLDKRGDPKHWNYVWTNFGDYVDNKIGILSFF